MICSNCQTNIPDKSKFCNNCGSKLRGICAQCGNQNPEGAKFCIECGTNLNTVPVGDNVVDQDSNTKDRLKSVGKKTAERRQLTCLFCDLVGSTAIASEMDAEDYRQYILEYQGIIEDVIGQYHGYVGNYLGDGLLVYFGYPKGIENAPRKAVKCGLAIIEAIARHNASSSSRQRQIHVRIGIHKGLVVVDEQMALGSTVNVTARLEGLAETNTIVISAEVMKLIEGYFEIISLGSHTLKGIARPMEVFQVIKESGASSRIEIAMGRGLSPLVGREKEVNKLLHLWKKAKSGKGQFLVLRGEAGIGKSRLVERIKSQIRQEVSASKLELRCSDYHVNSPFYPLNYLLEKRILRFEKEESSKSKVTKLEQWLDFAGIDKKPNLPIFADILSVPISSKLRARYSNPLLVAAGKRIKYTDGFTTAILNFALTQPVLLIVEDLHWMDSSSLEWLNQLVKNINTHPLFILGTTRPEFRAPWSNNSYISQLKLTRLNPGQIESICYHQTREKTLPIEILEQIKAKTDGVPLFVEELTRMIMESNLLIEKETKYEINPAHEKRFALAVPSTLHDSLIARLDKMSDSKGIAQIGAVLGREFSYEVLLAVAQKDEESMQHDLKQLVAAKLLFQKGSTYMFKHALIQDTAYESLLKSERQHLHRRAVLVLEQQFPELVERQPELLAHHLTAAGLNNEALLMWEKAANKAVSLNAIVNAVHHFQKALSLIEHIENESEKAEKELTLLVPYNSVLMIVQGFGLPGVEKNGTRILELCEVLGHSPLSLFGYYDLALLSLSQGEFGKAQSHIEKALILSENIESPDMRPLFNSMMGEVHSLAGDFTIGTRYYQKTNEQNREEKHQFLERSGFSVWYNNNFFLSFNLFVLGYPDQAKKLEEIIASKSREENMVFNISKIYHAKANYHWFRKEWQNAHSEYNKIRLLAEESGAMALIPLYQFLHESLSFQLGSIESYKNAKQRLDVFASINWLYYHTVFLTILAQGCHANRMVQEGLHCINEALRFTEKTKERIFLSLTHLCHGDLLVLDDQALAAEQAYQRAITIAQKQSSKWFELLAAKSLARLWQSQGKTTGAYEVLYGVYNWFTEGFDTIDMIEAKALLGEMESELS